MLAIELKRSGFDRGRPLAECPCCVADRLGTSGGEPLSDEKIVQLLNGEGFDVARRTVAKYREQMNIPVARLRKKLV